MNSIGSELHSPPKRFFPSGRCRGLSSRRGPEQQTRLFGSAPLPQQPAKDTTSRLLCPGISLSAPLVHNNSTPPQTSRNPNPHNHLAAPILLPGAKEHPHPLLPSNRK
jgi:hypothetical protein